MRRIVFTATAAGAMAAATPAHATGLIEPLIISLLTAAGINAGATIIGSLTVGAAVSSLATFAIGIGVALLTAPKPPNPEDGHQVVQQPLPPVAYGYGRFRIGGATVLQEAHDGKLYHVAALLGHEIIGVVGYYLNDDAVEVDEDGNVTPLADGRYGDPDDPVSDLITIQSRTGATPETAYAGLVAELPGVWTDDFRGDGIASLYMRCKSVSSKGFSTRYPYGLPQVSEVVDSCRVWDPRDPAQSWDDPLTWTDAGYDNAALALLHFECFSPYGALRDPQVAILPVVDMWKWAADVCDEEAALKSGGVERRYRCWGWTTTERTDPRGTRQQILAAMDGMTFERGDGALMIWPGRHVEPAVTLTDADIVGYTWDSGRPQSDISEWIAAKYCSPANGYSSADTDSVALDNGSSSTNGHRTAQLGLPWVPSTGQASRLLRREASRYSEPLRGEIILRLSGLQAIPERFIRVVSRIPLLEDAVIENRGPVISLAEGVVRMKFQTSGPHVDDYDAATMESSPRVIVTRPDDAVLPIPVIEAATAETIDVGGITVVYISVVIDQPIYESGEPRTDLSFDLRWAIDTTPLVWSEKRIDEYVVAGGMIELDTGTVVEGVTYVVEVASVSTSGRRSSWSISASVSTSVAGTAPGSPVIVSAVGGVGSATFVVRAPNSRNVDALRLWRGLTGSVFAAATDVSGALYCSPNQQITVIDTPAVGAWLYWATAENAAGTRSTPAGPVTVTVT
jgi:hypothetical protein